MVKFGRAKIIIQVIIGVAIILWLLQLANLADVYAVILQVKPLNLVAAVVSFITASTFVALALCTTLRRSNPVIPVRKIVMASFAGQLLSDVTPVRSGYFLTPIFINKLAGFPVEQGVTGVLATGGINAFVKAVVCLIGLGYFASYLPLPAEIINALLIGIMVLVIAGVFFMLLMWEKRLSKLVEKFERLPIIGKGFSKFAEIFGNVQTEGKRIKGSLAIVAALILLSIIANAAALSLIFSGIWRSSLSLLDFFFLASLASVLTYVPITIAGLGVQEAGYVLLLQLMLGIPLSTIDARLVAFALITRVLFTGTDIIGIGTLLKVGLKQDASILSKINPPK